MFHYNFFKKISKYMHESPTHSNSAPTKSDSTLNSSAATIAKATYASLEPREETHSSEPFQGPAVGQMEIS